MSLIGGKDVSSGNFTSSGWFNLNGGNTEDCTFTRIGPRHFITAGHCIPESYNGEVKLFSHKNGSFFNLKPYKIRSFDTVNYADLSDSRGVVLPSALNNKQDWAVMSFGFGTSIETFTSSKEAIKSGFDTRILGDPKSIRKKDTVLVAGAGHSDFDFGTLAICDKKTKVCKTNESLAPFIDRLKYAFFRIQHRGSGGNFIFSSNNRLLKQQSIVKNQFDFNIDTGSDISPLGKLAKGDSGGPVLNGSNELIGLIGGGTDYIRDQMYPKEEIPLSQNYFSTFDRQEVLKVLERPVIDIYPNKLDFDKIGNEQVPKDIKLYGFNLTKLKLKYLDPALGYRYLDKLGCQNSNEGNLTEITDFVCYKIPKEVMKSKKIEFEYVDIDGITEPFKEFITIEPQKSSCESGEDGVWLAGGGSGEDMKFSILPPFSYDIRLGYAGDILPNHVITKVTLVFSNVGSCFECLPPITGNIWDFSLSGENYSKIFSTTSGLPTKVEIDVTNFYKAFWDTHSRNDWPPKFPTLKLTSLQPNTVQETLWVTERYYGCKK
jgi:hypothetical protein